MFDTKHKSCLSSMLAFQNAYLPLHVYSQICTSNIYLKRKVKISILIKHVESKLFNQNGHFYFSFVSLVCM